MVFVERIEKSDRIVIIGTPLYRRKYENKDVSTGYVVAAEVDLISNRLLGTEPQKQSVLPVLLGRCVIGIRIPPPRGGCASSCDLPLWRAEYPRR